MDIYGFVCFVLLIFKALELGYDRCFNEPHATRNLAPNDTRPSTTTAGFMTLHMMCQSDVSATVIAEISKEHEESKVDGKWMYLTIVKPGFSYYFVSGED